MKTLLLIRHAKSTWSNPGQPDYERTLTESGRNDAKEMAERVREKSLTFHYFISSPAYRAVATARIFMFSFGETEKELFEVPALYPGTVENFYSTVEGLKESENDAAVFAHNPVITEFINSLDCSPVYNMPTCAVYALQIKSNLWKDFRVSEKQFLFFDYPHSDG